MSNLSRLEPFTAVFAPAIRHDLQHGAAELIGERLTLYPAWIIEDGPYEGQWACAPYADDERPQFAWVPECDLTDIKPGAA